MAVCEGISVAICETLVAKMHHGIDSDPVPELFILDPTLHPMFHSVCSVHSGLDKHIHLLLEIGQGPAIILV